MKKIDFAIALMSLLLLVLSSTLVERRVTGANLECSSVNDCCGSANCGGPGSVNGCTLTCTGGGTITCERKNKQGLCP